MKLLLQISYVLKQNKILKKKKNNEEKNHHNYRIINDIIVTTRKHTQTHTYLKN